MIIFINDAASTATIKLRTTITPNITTVATTTITTTIIMENINNYHLI